MDSAQDRLELHTRDVDHAAAPIAFFRDEFRFLSNFWASQHIVPIYLDVIRVLKDEEGKDWLRVPTLEHAYQAMKTTVPDERRVIASCPTPGKAKRAGQWVTMRPDWNEVRLRIMQNLVIEKFADARLQALLIDTGLRPLIEGNTWGDTFWGVCRGKGENHLGRILMTVRTLYREGTL